MLSHLGMSNPAFILYNTSPEAVSLRLLSVRLRGQRGMSNLINSYLSIINRLLFKQPLARIPVQMNNTLEWSTGTSMLWEEETVKSRDIEEIEIK